MAFEMFEQPIYVQRKHYIEEITGLDEWPQDRRDLVYEVMVGACRKAGSANSRLKLSQITSAAFSGGMASSPMSKMSPRICGGQ